MQSATYVQSETYVQLETYVQSETYESQSMCSLNQICKLLTRAPSNRFQKSIPSFFHHQLDGVPPDPVVSFPCSPTPRFVTQRWYRKQTSGVVHKKFLAPNGLNSFDAFTSNA